MYRTLLFTLCLFGLSMLSHAQVFQIPDPVHLNEAEDYAQYEEDVVACANWLLSTPLNQEAQKRRESNAFLLKWLMGSPSVTIELNPRVVTFMESSPELLIIFMAGWANYVLTTSEFDNKLKGNLAGLEFVMQFYQANGAMLDDKHVEKYIRLHQKGKLKAYLKRHI